MKKVFVLVIGIFAVSSIAECQTKRANVKAAPAVTKPGVARSTTVWRPVPRGTVAGQTYTNRTLGFQITFSEPWVVADESFKTYMKAKGVDLSPQPPKTTNPEDDKKLEADFKRLNFLLTVYRSLPGTDQNATAHIAVEDVRSLDTNRPVKDAVDYIDLLRYQMGHVKLPAGYQYSATQAERLGPNQFAYLDSTDKDVKTRLYVTVRKGYAILFSLVYYADDDLDTFRDTLARANFALK
jgi:hypothetical protein